MLIASFLPSGSSAMPLTDPSETSPCSVNTSRLAAASQTFTVMSLPDETRRRLSALNARLSTEPLCPRRVSGSSPLSWSQIRIKESLLPAAIRRSSGLNATL